MGNKASSSVSVSNNVTQISKNNIDIINNQINNLIVNEIQTESKNCGGGVYSSNDVVIDGLNVKGDINLGVNQSNEVYVNISCVQGTNIVSNISQQMISGLMADLSTTTSQEAASSMAASANSTQTSGFAAIPLGPTSSDSNVNMSNTFNQLSETNKKITNAVSNSITKNFSSSTVDNCIQTITQSNGFKLKNASSTDGGANIVIKQSNIATLLSSCIQNSGIANSITNAVTNSLGIKVVDTTTQESKSEAKAEATAESINRGPMESFGAMISGIFSGLFGSTGFIIASVIICCIIIVVGGIFLFMKSGGSSNPIQVSVDDMEGGFIDVKFISKLFKL
jgi:hypothetical protein